MRKLVAILAVTILVTACTPEQVAFVLQKEVRNATAEEVVRYPVAEQIAEQVHEEASFQFLAIAFAIHNDPFLVCTRAHESDSAGGYHAYNSAGPWLGAYQFLQSTWDSTAHHAELHQFAGANILETPGFVQDIMALVLYKWQGKGPWGGRC